MPGRRAPVRYRSWTLPRRACVGPAAATYPAATPALGGFSTVTVPTDPTLRVRRSCTPQKRCSSHKIDLHRQVIQTSELAASCLAPTRGRLNMGEFDELVELDVALYRAVLGAPGRTLAEIAEA